MGHRANHKVGTPLIAFRSAYVPFITNRLGVGTVMYRIRYELEPVEAYLAREDERRKNRDRVGSRLPLDTNVDRAWRNPLNMPPATTVLVLLFALGAIALPT